MIIKNLFKRIKNFDYSATFPLETSYTIYTKSMQLYTKIWILSY